VYNTALYRLRTYMGSVSTAHLIIDNCRDCVKQVVQGYLLNYYKTWSCNYVTQFDKMKYWYSFLFVLLSFYLQLIVRSVAWHYIYGVCFFTLGRLFFPLVYTCPAVWREYTVTFTQFMKLVSSLITYSLADNKELSRWTSLSL